METVLMMMVFAIDNHKIKAFRAKIGDSNEASLNMFRKLVPLSHPTKYFLLFVRVNIVNNHIKKRYLLHSHHTESFFLTK